MRDVMKPPPFLALLFASFFSWSCQQQVNAAAQRTNADENAGTLESAAPMSVARSAHTSTSLRDGRVLLAGGFTGEENAHNSAELYDDASRRFEPTGRMRTPRHSHTATPLPDGRILLAGGYGAGNVYLSSAEIYDPETDTFSPAGAMQSPRAGHVAVRLADDRVLLVGGVGTGWTFLSTAEIYTPATGTFSSTGSMSVPRESHVAVRLADNQVLIVGGHQGRRANIELFASMEIYDPASGTFRAAGDMTVRRHKHDAVLLNDGRVLITGGSDERDERGRYSSAEIFEPRTRMSSPAGTMRLPRYKHAGTSVVLPNGRVLIAGGAPQAEVYDPVSNAFTLVASETRMVGQFSTSAPLSKGRVLVTGGYGEGNGPQASAWLYNP